MKSAVERSFIFDTPVKATLRKMLVGGFARLGFALEPLDDTATFVDDDSTKVPELFHRLVTIPGMIPLRRCLHLYFLAYANSIPGDIIEIGSWQGRCTAFLAQACADTDNGVVRAIDTFRGNPGHERNYVVGAPDLSDLEGNFRANLRRVGLEHRVRLYPMSSTEARDAVAADTTSVRMIFIDGEHTYDAVRADLANYAGLLAPGGILLFDDYSKQFAGVARAIREHLGANPGRYARPLQQKNTLVIQRRPAVEIPAARPHVEPAVTSA